jgi:hypothetical protein
MQEMTPEFRRLRLQAFSSHAEAKAELDKIGDLQYWGREGDYGVYTLAEGGYRHMLLIHMETGHIRVLSIK